MGNIYDLNILGNWVDDACSWLHAYPDDTIFLLRHNNAVHLCVSVGNLPTDQNWKYVRMSDGKVCSINRLKFKKKVKALVLYCPEKSTT